MTRPDLFKCHHEPFGDAYYYGPERLGARFDGDSLEAIKSREESGFSKTTYKDVLEGLLAPSGTENEVGDLYESSPQLHIQLRDCLQICYDSLLDTALTTDSTDV